MEIGTWLNEESYIILTRILMAACLAGLIGIEREYKRHPAGFRTHMLVGVGACLAMLMALFGFQDYMSENEEYVRFDPSRLASYVISGVGFLGAGTIIVQGVSVKGLTTAASIWVVAAIGLAAGAGMYFAAIVTTIIVLLSLFFLNNVDRFFKTDLPEKLEITVNKQYLPLPYLMEILEEHHLKIRKVRTTTEEKQGYNVYTIYFKAPKTLAPVDLYNNLLDKRGVMHLEMELQQE